LDGTLNVTTPTDTPTLVTFDEHTLTGGCQKRLKYVTLRSILNYDELSAAHC
jgi:hypothetical protein